jgi:hypothetical protein
MESKVLDLRQLFGNEFIFVPTTRQTGGGNVHQYFGYRFGKALAALQVLKKSAPTFLETFLGLLSDDIDIQCVILSVFQDHIYLFDAEARNAPKKGHALQGID